MAFKTDTIKLNTGYTTNPTGIEGQLALVGTPGNRVLKLYDDGSWADVSSGGGGGGASELVDLNDVPSAPSTEDTVATVNSSNQLVFGKLTVDNIDASSLLLGAQGFVASDSALMTSAAIENKIEAYGYAVGNAANWDTAFGWDNHATQGYLTSVPQAQVNLIQKTTPMAAGTVQMNPEWDNVLWVNVADLSGVGYTIRADDQYATGVRLTLVNASTYPLTISPSFIGEWSADIPQLGLTNQASFELEAYQKAILFRGNAAQIWEVIILPA